LVLVQEMNRVDGKLPFHLVALEDADLINRYMKPYGQNSCQHSFVSMYSLQEKYADSVCEADDFLFTFRANLSDSAYRTYLAPMGAGDKKAAYETLLADAHAYGAKLRLETVTEEEKQFLEINFPGRFTCEPLRDYAEYIYDTQRMIDLPGHKLMKKRRELHQYQREYGARTQIELITRKDFPEILEFERFWLDQNAQTHDAESLLREYRCIEREFEHYEELGIRGIVLRIDGIVRGFSYGTDLNEECFDAMVEKGDRDIPNIYRILFQASVRQCAAKLKYVNREEDVGSPGLRLVKTTYEPEILLLKYLITEQ